MNNDRLEAKTTVNNKGYIANDIDYLAVFLWFHSGRNFLEIS